MLHRKGIGTFFSLALCQVALTAQGVWTQVASSGPSPRAGHAMVYDGQRSEVILFGGTDGTTKFGDTWAWDGTSWTQQSTSGPSGRTEHAMAYDSGRHVTVLFGGDTTSGLAGDTWEWNGSVWIPYLFTPGPSARAEHAMAFDEQRGVSVLFGGDSNSTLLGDTWEWDGASWLHVSSSGPSGRRGHAMAYASTQTGVVLAGGEHDVSQSGAYWTAGSPFCQLQPWSLTYVEQIAEAWTWDGAAWAAVSQQGALRRTDLGLVFDVMGERLLLVGGLDERAVFHPQNPGTNAWPACAQSPGSAGYVSTNPQTLGTNGSWDQGSTWRALASGPALSSLATAFDSARSQVVAFGGHISNGALSGNTFQWTGAPGIATTYGTGCGSPPLDLSPNTNQPPTIHTTGQVLLTNTPSALTFLLIG
ncbi:MAG: hypothetical protein KDE27_26875, partial [Planctomycetes bacterium]|nr:hypothetical protein [Planctomycetota bacterium]